MWSHELLIALSRTSGVLSNILLLYVVIAFIKRYYQHRHHVALIGLIGSTIAFAGLLTSGLTRLFADYHVYCDLRLGLYSFLAGSAVGNFFMAWHFTMKSRVLNVVPHTWNRLQLAAMVAATCIPGPAILTAMFTDVEPTRVNCRYRVPQLVVFAALIGSMFFNVLPMLAFVRPLIRTWHSIIPASQRESEGQLSLLFHALSQPNTFGTTTNRNPSTLERAKEHVATSNLLMKRQAQLVRRAFFATCSSLISTSLIMFIILMDVGGPAFTNNLYGVEQAVSWFLAILALPLPQERSIVHDQEMQRWCQQIDEKRGWAKFRSKLAYGLSKLII